MWYVLWAPVVFWLQKLHSETMLVHGWNWDDNLGMYVTVGNGDDALYNVQLKFKTEI